MQVKLRHLNQCVNEDEAEIFKHTKGNLHSRLAVKRDFSLPLKILQES